MWKLRKTLRRWVIPLGCCVLVIFLFQSVLMLGYVPSASMEPTIPAGSYILGLRVYGTPKRGDIVIFRFGGKTLVKRIAAVPGDTVRIDGAGVTAVIALTNDHGVTELTVPNGCYYLLGDNPADSYDSRYWLNPFISKEDILAKLIFP